MPDKNYNRLTFEERVKIETYLSEKRSFSFIAKMLNRSRSTIGKEVNRWDKDRYKAAFANQYATLYRKFKRAQHKIDDNKSLKIQVYKGLIEGCKPLQVNYTNRRLQKSYFSAFSHSYLEANCYF